MMKVKKRRLKTSESWLKNLRDGEPSELSEVRRERSRDMEKKKPRSGKIAKGLWVEPA